MSENGKSRRWIPFAAIGCGCLVLLIPAIGIISAIVIPNFVDAVGRAKQKRTVADMRTIGVAWWAWTVDNVSDGEAPSLQYGTISPEEIEAMLVPDYLLQPMWLDGWSHPYQFRIVGSESGGPALEIHSPGRDGLFTPAPETEEVFPAYELDRDIVWRDGEFVAYPSGVVN